MSVYTPTAVALGNITIPADGDARNAASVNVPIQAIADGVAYANSLVIERVDIIATNKTWTPGAGTTAATAELFGGGGAGGGGDGGSVTGTPFSACGGGGGGAAQPVVGTVQVTAGIGYVCTVGAGGTTGGASANGGDGGDSSFSTLLIGSGGQGGCGTNTGATSSQCLTQGGSPVRNAPAVIKVISTTPPGIACFADCAPGAGGIGFNAITGSAATKGIGSTTGYAGGSASSAGATVGGFVGGGGAGGGGGGPLGAGGNGGLGGIGSSTAAAAGNGQAGNSGAVNTGSGGGAGGAGGQGSTPGAGGAGGAGGSGRILIRYRGPAAVIT